MLELISRTHEWWNSLPSALQDDVHSDASSSAPQYGTFFSLLYHYLILLINRPFLSLPTHTVDFQLSLQSALNASRSIIALRLRHQEKPLLSSWPGTLSATWMAGLVTAFSGILELYPREKALVYVHRHLRAYPLPSSSFWLSQLIIGPSGTLAAASYSWMNWPAIG